MEKGKQKTRTYFLELVQELDKVEDRAFANFVH
jgi:hypothetical protein